MTYLLEKKFMSSSWRVSQWGSTIIVVVIVYVLLRFLFAADASAAKGSRVTPTLQYVVVVSRHGARGPKHTFPAFPYQCNDITYWPDGLMQLTNVGRRQMYELGEKIRSLYNGFLDHFYYSNSFAARSTDVERTLMSGKVFLAGLYPPKGFQIWNKDLLWQSIPIYFTYLDHTNMVSMDNPGRVCTRYKAAQNHSLNEFRREYLDDMVSLLEKTQPYTGNPLTEDPLYGLYRMWESIYYADVDGLHLPAWISLIYPEPLTSLTKKYHSAAAIGSFTQIRLLQGTLFKDIIGFIQSKTNGTSSADKKMDYYSCHDYTIMGLQGILGLWNSESLLVMPGSALILELHHNSSTGGYYIQVLNIDRHSSDLEPTSLDIPGCGSPCAFDRLAAITKKYYDIQDFDKECQLNT